MQGKSTTLLEMEYSVIDFLLLSDSPYSADYQVSSLEEDIGPTEISTQMCSSFAFDFVVRYFTLQSQLISNNKRQRICTAVLMTMSRQLTTADKIKSCLGQSPVSRHKMLFSTPAVMTHDMSTTVQFLCFCLLFSEILHCKVS